MCVDCGATGPERPNKKTGVSAFTGDWNTRSALKSPELPGRRDVENIEQKSFRCPHQNDPELPGDAKERIEEIAKKHYCFWYASEGDRTVAALTELHAQHQREREADRKPRLRDDWSEEDGEVLWWSFPIVEPPYFGSPLYGDWPVSEPTHWTPIQIPIEPNP